MKYCVPRRHRTGRCTPSYQESNVCHRAIMVVRLLSVRLSTTGRTVISRVHCVSSCNHGCPSPPCQAINYWKNAQLCQQFYYLSSSYSVHQGCENYQVTSTELWSFEMKRGNLKLNYNRAISFLVMLMALGTSES